MKSNKIEYRDRVMGAEARENRINLRYNESEYALIAKKAKRANLPIHHYCANVLLADAMKNK